MVIATGIMIAMIDIGPSPGSMPMNVPIRQPPTTIKIFVIEKAVANPIIRPSSISASVCHECGPGAEEDPQNHLD